MHFRVIYACVALVVLAAVASPVASLPQVSVPLPEARRDILSTAKSVLKTHPAFLGKAQLATRYWAYAKRLADGLREPLPFWRLLGDEELVLNYLHDPHTSLWADYSPFYSPDLLPVGFYWADGGLVLFRIQDSPTSVRTGDRVLAISGVPTSGVLLRLRRYVSGNSEWVHELAGQMLPFGNTLRWLGLARNGSVKILVEEPSGATRTLAFGLVPNDGFQDASYYYSGQADFIDRFEAPPGLTEPSGRNFYTYHVGRRYAIFWLTQCDVTAAYERAVNRFFRKVRAAHSRVIVIDLQQNPGGNSAAGLALMAHLPVRPRYAASYPLSSDIFHGRLYVLIDNGTMSSGVLIAEYLTEAGYGVLAGQAAGLASGAWGNVQPFTTPDGIGYQVSTTFEGPVNGVETPTLKPSIPLPVTVRDVQDGVNPVARWLLRLP